MAKASRRDWVFAGVAVAVAIAVGIALVIELTDEDDGPDSPFTRTTPWKKLRSLPDIGTLEYTCGFPGGLQATRLSVPSSGGPVAAGVNVAGRLSRAQVPPGRRFVSPYGPPGSFTWSMVRRVERGRIEVTVRGQPLSEPPVGRFSCPKPKFVVFTIQPIEPGGQD
jgi:hypothetical protein